MMMLVTTIIIEGTHCYQTNFYILTHALTHPHSACGSAGVFVSGFLLILLGYRPLLTFIGSLIPHSIQVGAGVGIGLLAALAGAVEVSLVVSGTSFMLTNSHTYSLTHSFM